MKRFVATLCACSAVFAGIVGAASAHGRHHPRNEARHHHSRVCGLDKEWLKTSMEGDLFEIEGGQIAKTKSTDPAVLRLANRLISDHTQSYHDAVKLARKLGVGVETEPSPTEQWELQVVRTFSGNAFDHWYSSLEVYDHIQDIQESADEAKDGCNREVRHEALTDIPTLRMHLALARAALAANPTP
jgi:putative membrane protein